MSLKFVRRKRFWGILGLLFLFGGVSAELYARFGLGLGDPPLMMADDRVEYLMQPGVYQRFGNEIRVNSYSMRSDEVSPTKTDPAEYRVLVLGDSVINGGSLTDHSELATTLVQSRLVKQTGRPVWVGNISEGSWGPGNLLAYTKEYGWFDADAVVVVLSSHDAGDVMEFKSLVDVSLSYPQNRPWLALQEAVVRYLPNAIALWSTRGSDVPTVRKRPLDIDLTRNEPRVEKALERFGRLLGAAGEAGRPVLYVHHAEARQELGGDWLPGYRWMLETATHSGAATVEMQPLLREVVEAGEQPYRDYIHYNAAGQRELADAITPWLMEALHATGDE